jgi:hypothetical protein
MPLPMFGPHPVTSATLPSRDTSNADRRLSLFRRTLPIMGRAHRAWQPAHRTELTSPALGECPNFRASPVA